MSNIEKLVQDRLFELQDLEYRDFQAKLMPTVDKNKIIGVRTPDLRKLSKEINKWENKTDFMNNLPHKYYEEDNLHAFLIEQIKDYDECIYTLDKFLLFVDNWATCDGISPKIFNENLDELYLKIQEWLSTSHTYTVRFGIVTLMKFFMGDKLDKKHLKLISSINSDEYYINMAVAWYFATALTCNWDMVIPYIENKNLDKWTHNKTIQKAIESYRITDEQKAYLKILKIKKTR